MPKGKKLVICLTEDQIQERFGPILKQLHPEFVADCVSSLANKILRSGELVNIFFDLMAKERDRVPAEDYHKFVDFYSRIREFTMALAGDDERFKTAVSRFCNKIHIA
jgi:hypothetical protein